MKYCAPLKVLTPVGPQMSKWTLALLRGMNGLSCCLPSLNTMHLIASPGLGLSLSSNLGIPTRTSDVLFRLPIDVAETIVPQMHARTNQVALRDRNTAESLDVNKTPQRPNLALLIDEKN